MAPIKEETQRRDATKSQICLPWTKGVDKESVEHLSERRASKPSSLPTYAPPTLVPTESHTMILTGARNRWQDYAGGRNTAVTANSQQEECTAERI